MKEQSVVSPLDMGPGIASSSQLVVEQGLIIGPDLQGRKVLASYAFSLVGKVVPRPLFEDEERVFSPRAQLGEPAMRSKVEVLLVWMNGTSAAFGHLNDDGEVCRDLELAHFDSVTIHAALE